MMPPFASLRGDAAVFTQSFTVLVGGRSCAENMQCPHDEILPLQCQHWPEESLRQEREVRNDLPAPEKQNCYFLHERQHTLPLLRSQDPDRRHC